MSLVWGWPDPWFVRSQRKTTSPHSKVILPFLPTFSQTLWIEWPFSIDDILKEEKEPDEENKIKKDFCENKNGKIEKIGGMKMCYDFWRVKREGWQLSLDHRVWIDWKYGFGKNQWTRVWPQLKGEGKKSAHVKCDGHKWVYFTRHPSLPFQIQTFGRLQEKARKEKFFPYLRGNCLGMYGTYRKYKLQGCCSWT